MPWKTWNNTVGIPHTAAVVAPRPSPIVFLHPNVSAQAEAGFAADSLQRIVGPISVLPLVGFASYVEPLGSKHDANRCDR